MVNKSKRKNVAKRDMFKWTERMDDAFINALLHQQKLGNRVDNSFTTAAYDNMLKELREKIGMPFEKDHLKNRLKTFKNHFKECFDIFDGVNGFLWSQETKMWSARPEVWKAFVKVKPEAKKWMTAQIAHYDKLVLLFGKDKNDRHNISKEKIGGFASSKFSHLFEPVLLPNDITINLDDLNETNDGTSQLATPVEENSHADSQARSKSATSLKGKKRKNLGVDMFVGEFKAITDAIRDVAEAIREGNLIAERGRPRVYSEEEVFAELVRIGFESRLRYKAYSFLVAETGRVRAFFGCPSEERKDYLLQMMHSQDS